METKIVLESSPGIEVTKLTFSMEKHEGASEHQVDPELNEICLEK